MKNHFNDAAYGYKCRKQDYLDTWQIHTKNTNHKLNSIWYSSSTTTNHKGFGGVQYQVTRDPDFAIYIAETAAKALAEKVLAEKAQTAARAQLAADAVNKACAEALAEHASPRAPSFFSRLLGRKP